MKLIGHAAIQGAFDRLFEKDVLAHAYAFVGPSHVGKATFARLCLSRLGLTPTHPDVSILERDLNEKTDALYEVIRVDQVRDLCERLSQSALGGGYKVAIIEEADRLHVGAANALLKTLEEPKGKTILFLCASSLEALPATIRSRCQIIRFQTVPAQEIERALREDHGLSAKEAKTYAKASMGAPGLALTLLRDGAARSRAQVETSNFLGLLEKSLPARLQAVAAIVKNEDTDRELDAWERALRDLLLEKVGCSQSRTDFSWQAGVYANHMSTQRVAYALHAVRESRDALSHHANPSLVFEHILLHV